MNNEGEYGKYIVQDLHDPIWVRRKFTAMYRKFSTAFMD